MNWAARGHTQGNGDLSGFIHTLVPVVAMATDGENVCVHTVCRHFKGYHNVSFRAKKSQTSCNFSNMSYSWPKACSNFPCVFTSLSNEPNDLRYRLKKRETASQCWLCFIQVQICNVKRQLFFPCQEDYKKFKKRAIQKQLHLWIFQFTKKSLSYQQIRLRLQFFYRFRA